MATTFDKDDYKSQQKVRHDNAMIELAVYGTSLASPQAHSTLTELKKAVIESADIHLSEALIYGLFMIALFSSSFFIEEPHVGVMFLLGAAFQVLGLVLLKVKMFRDKTACSVSCYSLGLLALSTCLRVVAMTGGAYIPLDAVTGGRYFNLLYHNAMSSKAIESGENHTTGGHIYIALQFGIMIQIVATLGVCYKFGRAKEAISTQTMIISFLVVLAIAIYIHPNHDEIRDQLNIFWAFAKNLEAIDMMPYLALAHRNEYIERFSLHFVVCMFISRVFVGFVFFTLYHEFSNQDTHSMLPGYMLFISHVVQLIILVDFIVHYVRAMMKNMKSVIEDGMVVDCI